MRSFLAAMYTYRRLRYATRWNRRLVFAVVIALLLLFSWRACRAWQRPPARAPLGKLA